MNNDYYPIQQPHDLPSKEKEDGMSAYFMMFASLAAGIPLPILNLVAAAIYYHANKHKSRFVQFHSLQSLVSQLPVSILNFGLVVWIIYLFRSNFDTSMWFVLYAVLTALFNLTYVILSIIAAIKARNGRMYYFLFFGNYCYEKVYKVRNIEDENYRKEKENYGK